MINLAYVALHLDPAQPPRDICQVGERKHLVTPGLRRTRPARLAATGRHYRQRPRGLQRSQPRARPTDRQTKLGQAQPLADPEQNATGRLAELLSLNPVDW